VDKPANPGGQRGFSHDAYTVDIHPPDGSVGITGNGDLRRQMQDAIRFSKGILQCRGVEDVCLDELCIAAG
jgi:hypothetical protein